MSTVKTTNLQHPSASEVGITLGADGSVVLPQGFTGAIGTNVVSTTKLDSFSTSSGSLVSVTGLTATITPTSATAKVLVLLTVPISNSNGAANVVQLVRDSTAIATSTGGVGTNNGTWSGNMTTALGSGRAPLSVSIAHLDSPATTSAVTYSVEIRTSIGPLYVGRSYTDSYGAVSNITVIEVAA